MTAFELWREADQAAGEAEAELTLIALRAGNDLLAACPPRELIDRVRSLRERAAHLFEVAMRDVRAAGQGDAPPSPASRRSLH